MAIFEPMTSQDDPVEIARTAQRHQERLEQALSTAAKRAARSDPGVRALFASARIKGQHKDTKTAVVSFTASPFRGGLHHFYPWGYLDRLTSRELAVDLSRMLRDDLARKLRGGG
ncbi:MAG TPA: hypothetical protein VFV75_16865 [Candidatus Polarisedimenticolaceae bacterium]|nr:hypothetical protein [Candidatus Polarisedimenticolaceae bacterium]